MAAKYFVAAAVSVHLPNFVSDDCSLILRKIFQLGCSVVLVMRACGRGIQQILHSLTFLVKSGKYGIRYTVIHRQY